MDPMHAAAAVLCVLVGLSLGLLGGGGSVLMVPLFIYVAKVPVNESIAMSLAIVGLSSAAGMVKYSKHGFVNKRLMLLFVAPGAVASFFGARTARLLSAEILLLMFGLLMMVIALVLFKKSSKNLGAEGPVVCRPGLMLSLVTGSGIGFLTGLLGVGGGFLIVPAIALLMKCSLQTAVGTSLAIIALNSAAGFIGHLSSMRLDLPLSALFLSATLAGAVSGTRMSHRFSQIFLQRAFSVLIFFVGSLVAAQYFYSKGGGNP